MSQKSTPWIEAQKKTFENWVNESLKDEGVKIEDIYVDFKQSSKLYTLYQVLTDKKIKHYDKNPRMKINYLGNLNLIINAFKDDKVRLVNVEGEDIFDQNGKIILGFIWMLIQHYHILGKGKKDKDGESGQKSNVKRQSAKQLLLEFVNSRVGDPRVKNFSSNWKDGDVLAKLIESVEPGSYPESERLSDPDESIQKSLQVAEEKLEVPKVIEPKYIRDAVDELSLMTYTTYLKKRYDENCLKVCPEKCIITGDIKKEALNAKDSPFEYQIELRNIYDELCPVELEKGPKNGVDTKFDGPDNVQANYNLLEPGKYAVSFDAVTPGDYTADVKIGDEGKSVKESPFAFKVDTAMVKVTGHAVEDSEFDNGQKKEFKVDSGTKSGGLLDSGALKVKVVDPNGNPVSVESKDNKDGTYDFAFVPESSGPHKIDVNLWDEPQFDKEVAYGEKEKEKEESVGEKAKVKVEGEVFDKKKFPDHRPTGLHVAVKDENGEKLEGANVSVDVKNSEGNPVGKSEVEEKGEGVYEISIDDITEEGEYEFDVKVDGYSKETAKANCVAGTVAEMVSGTFTFEVRAKDKRGNDKTTGGDLWEVTIDGPNDSNVEVQTKDHEDGRYSATYTLEAQEGGESTFKVNAKLNEEHVASSPFKHQLAPKPSPFKRMANFFKRK